MLVYKVQPDRLIAHSWLYERSWKIYWLIYLRNRQPRILFTHTRPDTCWLTLERSQQLPPLNIHTHDVGYISLTVIQLNNSRWLFCRSTAAREEEVWVLPLPERVPPPSSPRITLDRPICLAKWNFRSLQRWNLFLFCLLRVRYIAALGFEMFADNF